MENIKIFICILAAAVSLSGVAKIVYFDVDRVEGDATAVIRDALERVKGLEREDTAVINLYPGATYNLSRKRATEIIYHISNTTSADENPLPVKHVGILLNGINNLIINGHGAKLLTHGEMTPWVIDRCKNITINNLSVDAADPSVPEMTVTDVDSVSFIAKVHDISDYELRNGRLYWQGVYWEFTDGIAQIYDPVTETTQRCSSPLVKAEEIEESAPGVLKFRFNRSRRPDH